MRISEKMILKQVGDDWFAVSVESSESSTSRLVKLNSTGKIIWEGLSEGKTAEEIAAMLTDRYDVSYDRALQNATSVINKLKEEGILTED